MDIFPKNTCNLISSNYNKLALVDAISNNLVKS